MKISRFLFLIFASRDDGHQSWQTVSTQLLTCVSLVVSRDITLTIKIRTFFFFLITMRDVLMLPKSSETKMDLCLIRK